MIGHRLAAHVLALVVLRLCAIRAAAWLTPLVLPTAERVEAALDPQAVIDEIDIADSRDRLSAFVRNGWHALEPETPLEWNWHHEAICDHVQAALDGWIEARRCLRSGRTYQQAIRNLLVNVPPGSLKSRIVSVYAPAWMWLKAPDWSVICLSANPDVAVRDSILCRDLITGPWYQTCFRPDWQLKKARKTVSIFANTRGGFRSGKGMTARITGNRADAIFIDDPLDAKDVFTQARVNVNRNWDSAVENRVNDRRIAVRIGIMQRLHEEDWSGHVLAKKSPKWEHLSIPTEYVRKRARNDNGDPRRSAIGWFDPRNENGECIQPTRVTPETIAEERDKGAFYWSGQHQQDPQPAGGNIFKLESFRFWRKVGDAEEQPRPEGCWKGPARVLPPEALQRCVLSLDCTFAKTEGSDRVAFGVWGQLGADRFLLTVRVAQMSVVDTMRVLGELAAEYPTAYEKLVENKANGPAIIDLLRSHIAGLTPVDPKELGGDKIARAHASSPQVESGNVYLLDGAPWVPEFLAEVCGFPRAAHDDLVDMMTQALLRMRASSNVEKLIRALAAV